MSVIGINDDTHARTPMAAHQTLLILVGEMTAVITPGDPITPIGVDIAMIDHRDTEHVLRGHDTRADTGGNDQCLVAKHGKKH